MSKEVVWGWEWYDNLPPTVQMYVDPAERKRIRSAKINGKLYRPRATECADCGTDISKRNANALRCVTCSNKRHAAAVKRRQELYKRGTP